jgi:hypothetical protein
MANTIVFKDGNGDSITPTVTSNAASLTNNSSNRLVYNGTTVAEIVATLEASELVLTITPQTGANVFRINAAQFTPNSSGIASGGLRWQPLSVATGVVVTVYTPATSGHQLDWLLDPSAPPVPLTVKIKRF